MNACEWEVTITEAFWNSIERYYDERIAVLTLSAKTAPPEMAEEIEALECLIHTTRYVEEGTLDPSKFNCVLVTPETTAVFLYVLKVGPWRAYYDLDFDTIPKSAVCMFAIHYSENPQQVLADAWRGA